MVSKKVYLLIATLFILSACGGNSLSVYFFDHEFFSTPAISCARVDSVYGAKLLKINSFTPSEIEKIFEILEYHQDQVEGDYRNKLVYKGEMICSNIKDLLSMHVLSEEESAQMRKLLETIEMNADRWINLNPLPLPQ